jgi:CheY-like chemotaxis protein
MSIELKPRLLIAEDNTVNQKLISHVLKNLGYDFVIVEDGKKVLEALEKEAYDFIIMDLYMPIMDGFEATEQIMARFKPAQRPIIIALTGNSEGAEKDKCLAAGMTDFITKPVRPEQLKSIIEKWF